jgi:hypothetical protein
VAGDTVTVIDQLFSGTAGDTHNPGGDPAATFFEISSTLGGVSFDESLPVTGGPFGGYNDLSFTLALTAAVPEPSTYALMLAGLGFVGFIANRRRKSPHQA